MALSETQLLTVVAVLAVILGVILWNNVMAARARRPKGAEAEPSVSPFVAKFVQHEGSVVGEVVAVDGDRLVLKQAGAFKAVPRAQAEAKGDDVVLTGPIDWDAAAREGAAWHERNRRGADPAVAGTLTTSADVKSPALDALKERKDGP